MRPPSRQDRGHRLFALVGVLVVFCVPLYLTRAQTAEKAANVTVMASLEDGGESRVEESVYSIPEGDVFFRDSRPGGEGMGE